MMRKFTFKNTFLQTFVALSLLYSGGCSKAPVGKAKSPNAFAITTAPSPRSTPTVVPPVSFRLNSGGGTYIGTGMVVKATLGEPMRTSNGASAQTGGDSKVQPGLQGVLAGPK